MMIRYKLGLLFVALALIAGRPGLGAEKPYGPIPYPDNTTNLDKGIATVGDSPFFPSRATTDGHPVNHDSFDSNTVCSGCHMDIYNQWKGSMHSNSWTDPVYRAALSLMSKYSNGKVDNFCMGCHTPAGVVTKEASPAGTKMSEAAVQGVHCEVCHNISKVTGNGNGSYVLTPKLYGRPLKFGPYKDAVSPYHDTAYSQLHTQSEFCSDCHNVTNPFNNLEIERTYSEWKDSSYAGDKVQCQDCHMAPVKGRASPLGKDRDRVYTHYFIGGNALVTQLSGSETHSQRSEELLKSAATIKIMAPASLSPTHENHVQVRVTNVGAGHKLPSGFPEGREMWLDFKVLDAHNKEVYRLGAIKDGATEPGTKNFKITLGDKNNNPVALNVLEADRILTDTRIPPHGYGEVTYMFDLPKNVAGPVKIVAELNYWSFSQALLNELLGKNAPRAHVTEMATVTTTVPVGSSRVAYNNGR